MELFLAHKRALVVDDFPHMRTSLSAMLRQLGADDIDVAADGDEALRLLAVNAYDVILCDYNLGDGKDGQQVLEEARHRRLLRQSSIFIMVTAQSLAQHVLATIEYRPDDYLIKPFVRDVLLSRLQHAAARKRDLREIDRAIDAHDYARAMDLCEARILDQDRRSLDLLKYDAELALELGDHAKAASVYEQILKLRNLPWARFGLGKSKFMAGDYESAEQVFRSLIEQNELYVEAYDLLAETLRRVGDADAAQQVLTSATRLSPKSVKRQRTLGDRAFEAGNPEAAAQAYRAAIRYGANSCFRSSQEFTRLADVLMSQKQSAKALSVLKEAKAALQDSRNDLLHVAAKQAVAYTKLEQDANAREAFAEVTRLYQGESAPIPPEIAIEMARAALTLGEQDTSVEMLRDVVRNFHDDQAVLNAVQAMFKEFHLEEIGARLVDSECDQLIELNNRGVRLVQEGQLEPAIELFEQAAQGLPRSRTINLNAAQVLLTYLQQHGLDNALLARARQYLERVRDIDPGDPSHARYQDLLSQCHRVAER